MKKKYGLAIFIAFCLCMNGFQYMAATAKSIVDFSDGTKSFDKDWTLSTGAGESGKVVDNKYLNMPNTGIAEVISKTTMTIPYIFSIDTSYALPATQDTGIFIRGGRSTLTFPFYISDRNGGGNGGSGICIQLLSDKIRISIKNHQSTQTFCGSQSWECTTLPQGYNINNFTNLKAIDDGTKVIIKVMDATIATVEYSNPGVYEGDDDYIKGIYYKTAIMKDSNGAVVINETKARIAQDGYIAIGSNWTDVSYDNLSISPYTQEPVSSDPVTSDPVTPPNTGDNFLLYVIILMSTCILLACSQFILINKKKKV